MGEVDLHIHTTASDGVFSPCEIVQLARKRKLKAIAITDHDSVDGVQEALEEGRRISLEVIPGVEISADFERGSFHLLGYFIETTGSLLNEELGTLKEARSERNPRIVTKLNGLGIHITYDEVVRASGGGQVGRPHFAQVLVDKGYARSTQEAFARFLTQGAPAYVDKYRFEVKEAIEVVLKAGGVPVLAHPCTLNRIPRDLEALVAELVDQGLKGIEVFYPDHTPGQTAIYQSLAAKFRLAMTGGSDFHGPSIKKTELGIIGRGICLPYTMVEALKRVKNQLSSRPGAPG